MTQGLAWSAAWRIARRDLSARFRGLRLLLVCLFLGVGAIAAIGTLTGSIERELAGRGRAILGGDIEAEVWQRGLTPEERDAFSALGKLSQGTRMQAMAAAGDLTAPVALKAVDDSWPLVGKLRLLDGRLVGAPPAGSAWLAEGAAERLGVAPGEQVQIGGQELTVGGIVAEDPEQLGEGFALGASAITRSEIPERAGLTAPGAMFRTKARVTLDPGRNPQAVVESLEKQFPDAGFRFRTRDKAAPGAERFVARMGEFLVLVGLAALVIAGIGIGGGVSSYLEARRNSIATLKVLGATSGDIARIYLLQIGAAALAGSLAGLAAGVLVTPLLARALGTLLPVTPGFVFDTGALAKATAYGLLVALVFAAPPLVRARAFPAMALMRARISPLSLRRKELLLPVGIGLAAIIALALASAAQIQVTALFLAGAAVMLALLGGLGWAIRRLAVRLPRPRDPILRAGLANLHRPAAQTGALVTALGFGLSAFVLLAAIQTSLEANIMARVPNRAPDYFVLDVPRDRQEDFRSAVLQTVPGADIRMVPNLRGKILAYGPEGRMTRVADLAEIPDDAWFLRGERGLTYSDDLPEGSTLVAGEWWPKDYSGEPLVSIDEELAEATGLKIGDRLTIGLLGVERTARIASFRRLDWDSMGFNYVLVFSPNTLTDAPHNLAATIDVPGGERSSGLLRQLAQAFPSTSVIETGTLLTDARALLTQMSTAILAAASVAVLAGLAVLLGAIAAARASRTYDNVILRVLGASRKQLLILQLAEYGLLAAILALVSLAIGSMIAWAIIVEMFDFDWLPDWPRVIAVLLAGLGVVLAFALAGSLPLLRAKPARALREL
ncbi:MAG: FtsX-like permease family protein [Novosphingobium sp.]|nr:FtsX-like permease family protein [Novosphingobium sp.]MCP5403598.1 FtsX-like permease family protein [Novosphingobium sp.]